MSSSELAVEVYPLSFRQGDEVQSCNTGNLPVVRITHLAARAGKMTGCGDLFILLLKLLLL